MRVSACVSTSGSGWFNPSHLVCTNARDEATGPFCFAGASCVTSCCLSGGFFRKGRSETASVDRSGWRLSSSRRKNKIPQIANHREFHGCNPSVKCCLLSPGTKKREEGDLNISLGQADVTQVFHWALWSHKGSSYNTNSPATLQMAESLFFSLLRALSTRPEAPGPCWA